MPMPNTKAPMTSDGPIGAIAPPNPGTSAATGTITVAATAISSSAASSPPASPFTRKRRHAAVNENSAFRNATPSAKPSMISAAEAGCPSSATSAIRTAVPSAAAIRNGQSRRRIAVLLDVSSAAVVMLYCVPPAPLIPAQAGIQGSRSGSPLSRGRAESCCLRPEAERFLQVVPFGARRGERPARIRGPVDNGAVIEPHVLAAEQLGEHEPVGRGPVAGVAVGDGGSCGRVRGDRGKLRLRLEPIGMRLVERRAVDIHGARDVPIGPRGGGLLSAGEKRGRARVDQGRSEERRVGK